MSTLPIPEQQAGPQAEADESQPSLPAEPTAALSAAAAPADDDYAEEEGDDIGNRIGAGPGQANARRGRRGRRGKQGGEGGSAAVERKPQAGAAPANGKAEAKAAADVGEVISQLVSGAFDQEPEDAGAPQRRVLEPAEEAPKLHKLLAQIGIASRREIEELIMAGRISVNGEPAHIGQRILFSDQVRMNGKLLKLPVQPPKTRVLVYHKPAGEVSTTRDPEGRPTVFAKLPQIKHARWVSVGRLDLNTEGLLVFTTSGELANRLMHPRYEIEREYAVRVLGELSDEQMRQLREGVQLEDGPANFLSIEPCGGEGANRWYRVTIKEGRNREVRRMFEAVGHTVSRLIRVRYAHLPLPNLLRRGQWAELDERDVGELMRRVELGRNGKPQQQQGKNGGRGRRAPDRGGQRERDGRQGRSGGGPRQPDPLQTTFGYVQHGARPHAGGGRRGGGMGGNKRRGR